MQRNRIVKGLLGGLLVVAMLVSVLPTVILPAVATAVVSTTWYVDDSGGADFTTIQAAVDAASAGDTIIVKDGTYVENVAIAKSLTIQSQNGRATTTVQAADPSIDVFFINTNDVTIDGFTVQGVTAPYYGGITLWGEAGAEIAGCVIKNNDCSNDDIGFYVHQADNNAFEYNIGSNCRIAIFLENSAGNLVAKNTFSDNDFGVGLNYASSNVLYLNNIIDSATSNFWDETPGSSSGGIWNSQTPIDYSYNGVPYTGYAGNYWGGYSGSDADANGIGDTPYQTLTGPVEYDYYPLMGEWGVAITEPPPAVAPIAAFTSDVQSGTAPLTVIFTDQSTNTPTSWAWDFNNNGVVDSTAQNPSHIYTTAGIYTVKLTATNAGGSDDEVKTNYITVASPVPAWDLNGDRVCNIGDVVVIGLHWGETGTPGWIPQDLNSDGAINIGDVVVLGLHWGETW
jgi:parallel beta-helix repeat protein